jgi:hypothetical protein
LDNKDSGAENIEDKSTYILSLICISVAIHIHKKTNLMEYANSKEKTHSHIYMKIQSEIQIRIWHIKMYHKSPLVKAIL